MDEKGQGYLSRISESVSGKAGLRVTWWNIVGFSAGKISNWLEPGLVSVPAVILFFATCI